MRTRKGVDAGFIVKARCALLDLRRVWIGTAVLPQTDRDVEEGGGTLGDVEILPAGLGSGRHGKHNPGRTRVCPRSPREG